MDYQEYKPISTEILTAGSLSGLAKKIQEQSGMEAGSTLNLIIEMPVFSKRADNSSNSVPCSDLEEATRRIAGLYYQQRDQSLPTFSDTLLYIQSVPFVPLVYLATLKIIPDGTTNNTDTFYVVQDFSDAYTPFSGHNFNRDALKQIFYDGILKKANASFLGKLIPDRWKSWLKESLHALDERLKDLEQGRYQATLKAYTNQPVRHWIR